MVIGPGNPRCGYLYILADRSGDGEFAEATLQSGRRKHAMLNAANVQNPSREMEMLAKRRLLDVETRL